MRQLGAPNPSFFVSQKLHSLHGSTNRCPSASAIAGGEDVTANLSRTTGLWFRWYAAARLSKKSKMRSYQAASFQSESHNHEWCTIMNGARHVHWRRPAIGKIWNVSLLQPMISLKTPDINAWMRLDGAGSSMQKVFNLIVCKPLHALLLQDCGPVVSAALAADIINSSPTSKVKRVPCLLLQAPGILLDEEQKPQHPPWRHSVQSQWELLQIGASLT